MEADYPASVDLRSLAQLSGPLRAKTQMWPCPEGRRRQLWIVSLRNHLGIRFRCSRKGSSRPADPQEQGFEPHAVQSPFQMKRFRQSRYLSAECGNRMTRRHQVSSITLAFMANKSAAMLSFLVYGLFKAC